jgi:hypothetical protein
MQQTHLSNASQRQEEAKPSISEQKQLLGEQLFGILCTRYFSSNLAAKITGMLLEMDMSDIIYLLETPVELANQAERALFVLQDHEYPDAAGVQMPRDATDTVHNRAASLSEHCSPSSNTEPSSRAPNAKYKSSFARASTAAAENSSTAAASTTFPLASSAPVDHDQPRSNEHSTFMANSGSKYEESACMICMSNIKNALLVHGDEGHLLCCMQCAAILRGRPCPMCRKPVESIVRVFQ